MNVGRKTALQRNNSRDDCEHPNEQDDDGHASNSDGVIFTTAISPQSVRDNQDRPQCAYQEHVHNDFVMQLQMVYIKPR